MKQHTPYNRGGKETGAFGSGAKCRAGSPHAKGSNPPKVRGAKASANTPSKKGR